MNGIQLQGVEEPDGVIGQVDGAEALAREGRVAGAAMVIGDGLEVIVELGQEGLAPVEVGPAQALDEQQRLPTPAAYVVELVAGDLDVGHAGTRYKGSTSWGGVSPAPAAKPATRTPSRRTARVAPNSRRSSHATSPTNSASFIGAVSVRARV